MKQVNLVEKLILLMDGIQLARERSKGMACCGLECLQADRPSNTRGERLVDLAGQRRRQGLALLKTVRF